MNKILVTGGCGYIGSHTIVDLIESGFDVISADNLINSEDSVLQGIKDITGVAVKNYEVDLTDAVATKRIFDDNPDLIGVIHFAALKAVGESCEQPFRYFKNNLNSLINVLEMAQKYKLPHFIFSSSCTVYGNTDALPVTEETPQQPAESPYGRTKQMGEQIIEDALTTGLTRAISLRYFNPAGAHSSAKIGESPATKAQNLVPVITETAIGKRQHMYVHGQDYDTRDGSCIRDYIHVMDLARAHTLAMQYLVATDDAPRYDTFNLGIGEGVSVMEAIQAFEKVSDQSLNYKIGPRRSGDVVAIYADYSKARETIGWEPTRSIEDIMSSAWRWEQVRS